MLKLDFGSGRAKLDGYITIDKDPAVGADICVDIERMKFDGCVLCDANGEVVDDIMFDGIDEIRAYHFLEHIDPKYKVKIMRLIFDVLKPGGIVDIEVPCFPHDAAVQDPTHVSFWNVASFWYFTKGNKFGEAFAARCSKPWQSPLFEFVSEEKKCTGAETVPWAYQITLRKPCQ